MRQHYKAHVFQKFSSFSLNLLFFNICLSGLCHIYVLVVERFAVVQVSKFNCCLICSVVSFGSVTFLLMIRMPDKEYYLWVVSHGEGIWFYLYNYKIFFLVLREVLGSFCWMHLSQISYLACTCSQSVPCFY